MTEIINEKLDTSAEPNVATIDQNLNLGKLYQQTLLPSMARVLFPELKMFGPSGKVFNIRKKEDATDIELISSLMDVYPSDPIKTNITREALQDIFAMFGIDGVKSLAKMLRASANEQENKKLIEFLQANSHDEGTLNLSDPLNAETQMFEITNKVQGLVLKANSVSKRTFRAYAMLPYEYVAPIMTTTQYTLGVNTSDINELKGVQIGLTKYYMNPIVEDKTCYVGLSDKEINIGASAAFFGDYTNDLIEATHPDTGNLSYFIYNRFGLQVSPLHSDENPMMFKFSITK